MQKVDVLGYRYNDDEPAFTAVESGMYYYHIRTKKLYEREAFNARMEATGRAFAEGELGIPSDEFIALREDMLENLYTPTVPPAPSGAIATANGVGQIDLTWVDASDNEAGFRIERSTDDSLYTPLTSIPAGVEIYSDRGLFASTMYYYRIYAFNVTGDSDTAASASATTEA